MTTLRMKKDHLWDSCSTIGTGLGSWEYPYESPRESGAAEVSRAPRICQRRSDAIEPDAKLVGRDRRVAEAEPSAERLAERLARREGHAGAHGLLDEPPRVVPRPPARHAHERVGARVGRVEVR